MGVTEKVQNHEAIEPTDLIVIDKRANGVATITINRPQALNALTKSMMNDLAKGFKDLNHDNDVKVIIFTGSGRAFCSGVDLFAAANVFKGNVKDKDADPVFQMESCSKPIIGAINGYAVTAGFELSLACDILVASTDAKFIDTHCKFGIFPSWGLSQKLPRVIGVNRARQISFTAMPLDAELACSWGLVNVVVPPEKLLETAHNIANKILKNQEDMVLRYKAAINDGFKLPLGDALKLEKERGHEYYDQMTPEHFSNLQKIMEARSSSTGKITSKL